MVICATLPLPQKVHVSRSLMARKTELCMVVPVFSTIIAVFPSTRVCVSAHIYRAESARWQRSSQVTPDLWVLSRELASCHPCCARSLEVVPSFSENLWAPGYLTVTGHHMYKNLQKSGVSKFSKLRPGIEWCYLYHWVHSCIQETTYRLH
jgi:hypothetical protein